jgi:hypothetical protein
LPLVELPKFTREEKDIHRVHRAVEEKKVTREQRQQSALEEKKVTREQRQQSALEEKKVIREQRQQPALEEKKAAREQRRRFRRSEDFLGVQGANPITGMWDISDYTSTTEQMSAETQKRVDNQVKELAEAQRRYEEAQKSHQEMLQRVQALRDEKQEEKEQKKLAEKIKRRRGERWRLTENGWSTDLSPIVQSPCTPTAGEYIKEQMLTFFITDILLATPSSAASSPFIQSPPVTPLNIGSSESQHTVIHELPDPFLVSPSPPSSTNIYTTTTTIIGCDQQQKEQLQRREGEDTEGHLDELMKTRIEHTGSVFGVFLNYFNTTEDALLVAGIFTLGLVGSVFF